MTVLKDVAEECSFAAMDLMGSLKVVAERAGGGGDEVPAAAVLRLHVVVLVRNSCPRVCRRTDRARGRCHDVVGVVAVVALQFHADAEMLVPVRVHATTEVHDA